MRFGRAKEKEESFPRNHVSLISYPSVDSVWAALEGGGLQGNSPSLETDTNGVSAAFA